MIGHVYPLMVDAAKVVNTGSSETATTYVTANWPKDSSSLVKVVLDNKGGTVDRIIKKLIVEIEVAARSAGTEGESTSASRSAIREEILKNYQPTSLDSGFFTGIKVETDVASLDDIKLPMILELKDPAGAEGLKGWITQVAQRVSSLTMMNISVGEMELNGSQLTVPLEIKGFQEMMKKVEEERQLEEADKGPQQI